MESFDLDDDEIDVILEEFLYGGEVRSGSSKKTEIVKKFLSSKTYTDMVESLMSEQFNAEKVNVTNAKVYNFDGTYNIWVAENEKDRIEKLDEMDKETANNFKPYGTVQNRADDPIL